MTGDEIRTWLGWGDDVEIPDRVIQAMMGIKVPTTGPQEVRALQVYLKACKLPGEVIEVKTVDRTTFETVPSVATEAALQSEERPRPAVQDVRRRRPTGMQTAVPDLEKEEK